MRRENLLGWLLLILAVVWVVLINLGQVTRGLGGVMVGICASLGTMLLVVGYRRGRR